MSQVRKQDRWFEEISGWIQKIGYELVHLETLTGPQNTLRLFIDHPQGSPVEGSVGVEDCAKVSREVDEILEAWNERENLFQGEYSLEVSSPGVNRPLRKEKDYERFQGREARIHVFRPLSAEELGNDVYQNQNPRQKNFLGVLRGLESGKIRLEIKESTSQPKRKGKAQKKVKVSSEMEQQEVLIPLALISKANLEPSFDWLEE